MRKYRAVIFDDEEIITRMLQTFFSKRGYEVFCYGEPTLCPPYEKHAENCTQEYPCADGILTDFSMPRMDGITFLKHQHARGCKLDSRDKAAMSAYLDEDRLREIHSLGCSYFQKPFKLSEISMWVNECEKRIDLSRQISVI